MDVNEGSVNEGTVKKFKYPSGYQLVYPEDLGDRITKNKKTGEIIRRPDFVFEESIRFSVQDRLSVSIDSAKELGTGAKKYLDDKIFDAYKNAGISEKKVQAIKNKYTSSPEKSKPDKEKNELIKAELQAEAKAAGVKPPEQTFGQVLVGAMSAGVNAARERIDKDMGRSQKSRELGRIYLNMPNAIQFNESADWSGQELGIMGKGTQDLLTGQGDTADVAKGAVAGNVGNIVGAGVGGIPTLMSKMGIKGGMFGAAIGALAAGSPIQKGLESTFGVVQNPYLEMMFSGIGFRQFQFDFTFRPRNDTEQKTVHQIIKMFRLNSRPTFTEQGLGKSFMDYPKEFRIDFLTKCEGPEKHDEEGVWIINTAVPQLKTCVCTNVSTNYAPDNMWLAHKGGKPNAIQLSMSFKETELVMAKDVGVGGESYGGN